MIAEIGHFALILSVNGGFIECIAIVGGFQQQHHADE